MRVKLTLHKKYWQLLIIITIALIIVYAINNRLLKNSISETCINPQADKIFSDILSTDLSQELVPRVVVGPDVEYRDDLYELDTYHYDFNKIEEIHTEIADLDTRAILQRLFSEVTSGVPQNADTEKWLRFADFVSRRIRHPPFTQPMHADKTMITHPLVLLLLGEGRCGHVARVIVDVALANKYEARLVQLAAHIVAEVKWDGHWHFVDANADFPLESLQAIFDDLPSIQELSKTPYLIDQLPARGFMWSERDKRSITGAKIPYVSWYPGMPLTSSIYFAEQILHNKYSGDPNNPRKGIQYWHKKGTFDDWQTDQYYGWKNLILNEEQAIVPIPTEFHPMPISISAPVIIYATGDDVEIPVRFFPLKRVAISGEEVFHVYYDQSKVRYEVRVSSKSRGWDYNFRNYKFMPALGKADIAIYQSVTAYDNGMLGVDVKLKGDFLKQLKGETELFIEVVPKLNSLQKRGHFTWPSREVSVEIYSPKYYQKWNYGKKQ